mmetsp:Transcript_9061/g.18330  ORF Transcript_9061/g.18330 Transcript_9061/m.18330 type:complete len:808 (-) Transcript_9061:356-2779(-)
MQRWSGGDGERRAWDARPLGYVLPTGYHTCFGFGHAPLTRCGRSRKSKARWRAVVKTEEDRTSEMHWLLRQLRRWFPIVDSSQRGNQKRVTEPHSGETPMDMDRGRGILEERFRRTFDQESFGGLPITFVENVVREGISRRERMRRVMRTTLVTILPYDLQREVFGEIRRIYDRKANHKVEAIGQESDVDSSERDRKADQRQAEKGNPSGWWWNPIVSIWRGNGAAGDQLDDQPAKESANQVMAMAGASLGSSVEMDDFDASLGSASAAFATARAMVDHERVGRFHQSRAAEELRMLVKSAQAVATPEAAREFVEKIGVTGLVVAVRLLRDSSLPGAVMALATIAFLYPSSRKDILKSDEESIIPSLTRLIVNESGENFGDEVRVSASHLIGSLALTTGEGGEWRATMAKHAELVKTLERICKSTRNVELERRAARRALASLGINPWKPRTPGQRGLRILTLDGGGTRAIMSFEILKHMKHVTGCEIHEMFDIIAGTSTGAIIALSLGIHHKPVEEVESLYRELIGQVFAKHPVNTPKMLLTRAYYDTKRLEDILKRECGTGLFIDSSSDPSTNKVIVVSSLMSRIPRELHVFRNYTHPLGHESRYSGTVEAELWEGLRASSAAPTFFSEIRVNGELHADGAIVANNPAAVALHEAKCMYPGVPVEILVSLGNGVDARATYRKDSVGWNDMLGSIIDSAISTEYVHHTLLDLLPPEKYFRFNPFTEHPVIDEVRPVKLAFWVEETKKYIAGNEDRFLELAELLRPKVSVSWWSQVRAVFDEELNFLRRTLSGPEDLFLGREGGRRRE